MKNLIAATLITTVTATSAFAHGGGLNQNGCHNNHSNGTYHCHRHQPANNHDMDNAAKVLGGLFLLGVLLHAAEQNQCTKDWRVLENYHDRVVIGEVDCNGRVLQTEIVYR